MRELDYCHGGCGKRVRVDLCGECEIAQRAESQYEAELAKLRAEVERLRDVIHTGGAMYRGERAAMGIPGGVDEDSVSLMRADLARARAEVEEHNGRLDGYRELGAKVAKAEQERDEARASEARVRALAGNYLLVSMDAKPRHHDACSVRRLRGSYCDCGADELADALRGERPAK